MKSVKVTKCSKCRRRPRAGSDFYCNVCRRQYMREYRAGAARAKRPKAGKGK